MQERHSAWTRPIWPWAVLLLALVSVTPAAETPDDAVRSHPRTALVLSGGGARGAAHVGVLQVLEELQIPIDLIIGTSMGSIVGGLYSSGLSPEEMQEAIAAIDWQASFDDQPPRRFIPFRQKEIERRPVFKIEFGFGKGGFKMPSGIVAGQKLNFILRTMTLHATEVTSFDDLPVPFRAVAVDLDSGETVVLDHGDLAQSMRASMAFPLVFTPVEIDGRLLVDGGVTLNLPIEVALEMGAERIIAVDVGTPLKSMGDKTSALGVMRRTTSVMAKQGRADQIEMLREQDLLIVPELDEITTFGGFEMIDEAVERGAEAARAVEERLREFAKPGQKFDRYLSTQRFGNDALDVTIAEVEVVGVSRLSPKLVAKRIQTRPGQKLDLEMLQEDLERVYKIGEFEQVAFRLEPMGGSDYRLVIEAVEKSWGPWYVRPGAGIEANLDSRGRVTLLALVERPQLNRLNGGWRNWVGIGDRGFIESEFYQPLEHTGTFFVAPRVEFLRTNDMPVWVLDQTEYVTQEYQAAHLDLGLALGNFAELRAGIMTGSQEAEAKFLEVDPPEVDLGGYVGRFRVDTLDHPNFPRLGTFVDLRMNLSRETLGADEEFDRLELGIGKVWKVSRKGSFGGRLRYGTDLGSDLPYYAQFSLGGLFNLSGTNLNSLVGPRMGLGELFYFRRVGEMPGILGGATYIGGSLEAGNVWQSWQDPSISDLIYAGSLYIGVDTLLGPVYVAYGHASSGDNNLYLYLGRLF